MKVSEPYTIFPRTLSSGKIVYYYQFRLDNGTRSSAKSTGCTTEAQAKRYCKQLYNSGEFNQFSQIRFENYTKDFFSKESDYYKWKIVNNSHITDETLYAYNKALKYQLMPFFSEYSINKITRSAVKKWVIWASESWSAKTVNNAQSVLNLIMNQAVEQELIGFNPLANLAFRETGKKVRNILSIEEVKQIYHSEYWKNEKVRTIFLLECITGLRIGELISLTHEDIKGNYLDIKHNLSRMFGIGDTKTHANRCVPIPEDFPFPNDNEYVFYEKGVIISEAKVYKTLMRLLDKMGIDHKSRGVTVHTLRNFYISYLQSKNISEAKIRAVVGHKDSSMTGLYTYWKPEMFPEVYEAQKELFKFIRR